MLSALHGYHAVSMYRKLLGIGYENCVIQGQKFVSPVTATNGREGFDRSGRIMEEERDWVSLRFENGKTALMDFAGEQYFSLIRRRRWNIRGLRGEINDEAVDFLTKYTPDLILLDYLMPVHNGAAVLKDIQSRVETKNIPVFFLTGQTDADTIRECLALHPAGYIVKPVAKTALLDKMKEVLG